MTSYIINYKHTESDKYKTKTYFQFSTIKNRKIGYVILTYNKITNSYYSSEMSDKNLYLTLIKILNLRIGNTDSLLLNLYKILNNMKYVTEKDLSKSNNKLLVKLKLL